MLTTETRNKESLNIDKATSEEIAKIINDQDKLIAESITSERENIARAIDEIAQRFSRGGRIIYMGAGTSGRLGSLDAIELTPTYGVAPSRAFGILAGGAEAMYKAVEGAEDSKELAIEDLKNVKLNANDTVIGIAASGNTPYTLSALEYANGLDALTISVTCNKDCLMQKEAKIAIAAVVGPEVITGSTRMKAGTAQKMILNTISTGVMIKVGYVYENLMINVQATNKKLEKRSESILQNILNISEDVSHILFKESNKNVATAIVMYKKNISESEALTLLDKNDGVVSKALS